MPTLKAPIDNKQLCKKLMFLNYVCPIILAFLSSAIFCLIDGDNPFEVYKLIFTKAFSTKQGIMNTLGYAAPILMTGIATSFSIRAGVFNMGIEGQVYMGSFTAAIAGAYIKLPHIPHVIVVIFFGALGGMLWSLIPGILKSKLQINEIVTTIMLNNVALTITKFLANGPFNANYAYTSTPNILETAELSRLMPKYKVTTSLFIALGLLLIVWYILKRTKFGYEIQFLGRQQEFSDATGMRVDKKIILVFALGGVVAGIAGATEVQSVYKAFLPNWGGDMGIGWDGFSVCVLANGSPFGCLLVSILLGGFRYGCIVLQTKLGTPVELNNIVKCAIILFFFIKYISTNMEFPKLLKLINRNRNTTVLEEEK